MKKFQLKSTVIAMSLLSFTSLAYAQEEPKTEKDEEVEKITVTGTRIINALPTERLMIFDAKTIEDSGASSVESLLQMLPSNSNSGNSSTGISGSGAAKTGGNSEFNDNGASSPNLRGLGANATLVLINGRRPATSASGRGASTDIASIPVDAIDRIEIYAGGASAIYGADAVGGVINIIMKKDYAGTSVSLRYGDSSSNADDMSMSIQSGFDWDTGNAVFNARYAEQKAIESDAFKYSSNDLREYGGNNYESTSPYGLFHNYDTGADGQRPIDMSGPLVESDLLINDDITWSDSRPLYLAPESENLSFYTAITQELGDFAELAFDARYSKRDTTYIGIAPITNYLFFPGDVGNPYNAFTAYTYQFSREVDEGIIPRHSSRSETEQFDLGVTLTGELDLTDTSVWSWNVTLAHGEEKSDAKFSGVDSNELYDFGELDIFASDYLDDASAAYLKSITSNNIESERQNDTSAITTFEASISGALMELPAGELSIALGGEYRVQDFESPGADLENPFLRFSEAERAVTSAFAEINIPVFSSENQIPFFAELTFSAAVRYEKYDDSIFKVATEYTNTGPVTTSGFVDLDREATSPKIGVSWRPISELRLTANWGESFLAPPLNSIAFPTQSGMRPIYDLNAPGGPSYTFAEQITGGNINAENEDADTLTLGLDYRPHFIEGLQFNLDYYKVEYKNRMTGVPSHFYFENEEQYPEYIKRDGNGILTSFYSPFFINALQETIKGLDIGLIYSIDAFGGRITSRTNVNHVLEDVRQLSADVEAEHIEGTIDGPIEWSGRTQLSLERDSWQVTAAINYKDGYSLDVLPNIQEGDISDVSSSTTVDLQFSYSLQDQNGWLKDMEINAGATNVFDEDPPFLNDATGVSSYTYDLRRRVVYLEVRKSF